MCFQEEEGTYSPEIPNTNLQSHAGTPLVRSRQVVAEPGNDARKRRVDGAGREEDAGVHDLGVGRRDAPAAVSVSSFLSEGHVHGKPGNHDQEEPYDKGTPLADPVREPRRHHSQDRRGDVHGNRE